MVAVKEGLVLRGWLVFIQFLPQVSPETRVQVVFLGDAEKTSKGEGK